jgi:hypothetical protein
MEAPDRDTLPVNTDQQYAFVRRVVEGMSYRDAAVEVGYSARYGPRLAEKEHIQRAISVLQQEAREESAVTAARVAEGLLEEAERTGEGASHSARVRAWELLGEHIGMFDETRSDGEGTEVTVFQQINEHIQQG